MRTMPNNDCACTRNQRAGVDPPGANCVCRRTDRSWERGEKRLAWSGWDDDGTAADVFLIMGGYGQLIITLPSGRRWATDIDLSEIAIFMARDERPEIVSLYIEEMVLNAKAALQ